MAVKPIPDGFHTVTPYLIVKGAADAIAFYKKAFGATELLRLQGPDGRIGHAEIKIGDAPVMLADEAPQMGAVAPQPGAGKSVSFMLYVEDVDAVFDRAVAAGATAERPVVDQFYGVRMGTVADPFGHHWLIGTQTEEVPSGELQRRFEAMMKKGLGGG